jgi:hypothetical protein
MTWTTAKITTALVMSWAMPPVSGIRACMGAGS